MKADKPASLSLTQSMMRAVISSASVFTTVLLSFSCSVSQMELLNEVSSLEKRLSARLQPTVRSWIDDQAAKLARFSVEEDGVRAAMGRRFAGQDLGNDAREALTFLTVARAVDLLYQQVNSFEEHQRAIRATTEKLGEILPRLEADLKRNADLHDLAPVPPECMWYKEELVKLAALMERTPSWTIIVPRDPYAISSLRSLLDELKGKLDGMNEMSEMTSLRLQMTMDRRSKFIETLSNIMKKVSTTGEAIIQNIK